MSKVEVSNNPMRMLTEVRAEFGDERDVYLLIEAVREQVVVKLVDKFVKLHGDEVLAQIDLETIKVKTNEKVTVAALRELVK